MLNFLCIPVSCKFEYHSKEEKLTAKVVLDFKVASCYENRTVSPEIGGSGKMSSKRKAKGSAGLLRIKILHLCTLGVMSLSLRSCTYLLNLVLAVVFL